VDFIGERLGVGDIGLDARTQRRSGSKAEVAQPVVADHPVLIWVRDLARFEVLHVGERLLNLGLHLGEEVVGKLHPRDVEREAEVRIADEILLEALPEVHGGSELEPNGKGRNRAMGVSADASIKADRPEAVSGFN
jgi:hypothetical protein